MLKYTATPIVWIRITNEQVELPVRMELHKFIGDNGLYPAIHAGGSGPKSDNHGYYPEDAEKILQWLKDHGAQEDDDG